VIIDSALRDALPIFDFNDFADQMAYAAVSRALTKRALAEPAAAAANLPVGTRVHFLGVAQVGDPSAPLSVLPVQLDAAN
jgi:predicted lipoprotein